MNSRTYSIYTVVVVSVLFLSLSFACLFSPEKDYSESERRALTGFPSVSLQTLANGQFMNDFTDYSLDQFPLRDGFRRIKAVSQYSIFRFRDNNGIYISDGHAAKMVYPLKEDSVINAADKFGKIYDMYLSENDNKIIASVVPDKGYFLGEKRGFLSMDYTKMENIFADNMPFAKYVSIYDTLSIEDYYYTDTHLRQDKIRDTALRIAYALDVNINEDYTIKEATDEFLGVYYSQSALPLAPDSINYVTSDSIEEAVVYNYENGSTGGVYNFDKLQSKDPYEFFLSGACALMTIDSPSSDNDKNLVIFRDSYASSIIPYFIGAYSKITLVDTRYIDPSLLSEYVDFSDCDVIFLYSTMVLNESSVLRWLLSKYFLKYFI